MALNETIGIMRQHLAELVRDLEKAAGGNRAEPSGCARNRLNLQKQPKYSAKNRWTKRRESQ